MQTKRFVQDLKDEIKYEKEYKYQVPFEKGSYYDNLVYIISTSLEDNTLVPTYFNFFKDLFGFHFEYSAFAYTELHSNEDALMHLSKAIQYGNILLNEAKKTCGCVKGNNPFLVSNKAVFMTSISLLIKEDEAFNTSVENLIDSLNGENCFIKKGYNKATTSWFVLKLYSLYSKKEITLHRLLQPKLEESFLIVLEDWNSEDVDDVAMYIDILCNLHLLQAEHDLADADSDDAVNNLRYRELYLPAMYAFPYEILTWLKLREKAGLKNPTEFSHPLMNTPIAKMFLDIKEPLPKPTELPFAKELLKKLQEKCPNVEIPTWLDGKEVSVEENKPSDNIIPDDFMG